MIPDEPPFWGKLDCRTRINSGAAVFICIAVFAVRGMSMLRRYGLKMPAHVFLIIASLTAFGPLAIDFYLASFSDLATAFGTTTDQVQLSMTVYLAGLAIGQLIYGPLSDRYGRRPPLLWGVALFTVASLGCALATSLEWLIIARFVQALGGCAGMVIARAIVRDRCGPVDSARAFSQLMLITGLAPILAPIAGGWMLLFFGWESIFYALMVFAGLCFAAVLFWLPESLPQDFEPPQLGAAFLKYRLLFQDRSFLMNALIGGVAISGMFVYIATSPFVFMELYGVPETHFGWYFGANSLGFMLAAQLNARLLRRFGPAHWMRRASLIYVVCAATMLVIALWQPASLWPLLIPLLGCIASLGGIMPNAAACAMAGQGMHAGAASALMGSMQFVIAASLTGVARLLHDDTAMPMALMLLVCGVVAAVLSWMTSMRPPAISQ